MGVQKKKAAHSKFWFLEGILKERELVCLCAFCLLAASAMLPRNEVGKKRNPSNSDKPLRPKKPRGDQDSGQFSSTSPLSPSQTEEAHSAATRINFTTQGAPSRTNIVLTVTPDPKLTPIVFFTFIARRECHRPPQGSVKDSWAVLDWLPSRQAQPSQ